MTALQAEPTGTLRLNVPRPAARLVLAPMLAGFVAKYPRVQVDVVTDDGLADIVGMASMPAFATARVWPEAWWRRLSGRRSCMRGRAVYLVLRGTPRTPRELPGHACIGRRFPSGHRYAWEFQVKGEPLAIEVNGPLVFDDDVPMIQAACDGAGVAYVYEAMVREDLAAGRLVALLRDYVAPPGGSFSTRGGGTACGAAGLGRFHSGVTELAAGHRADPAGWVPCRPEYACKSTPDSPLAFHGISSRLGKPEEPPVWSAASQSWTLNDQDGYRHMPGRYQGPWFC